jgi:cold-inducible RNA-binding protein
MGARLYVGNLSFSLTDDALRDAFAAVGEVERAEVVRDKFDHRSRGFGFVEMALPEDAERAIRELNGLEIAGRRVRVESALTVRRGATRGSSGTRASNA